MAELCLRPCSQWQRQGGDISPKTLLTAMMLSTESANSTVRSRATSTLPGAPKSAARPRIGRELGQRPTSMATKKLGHKKPRASQEVGLHLKGLVALSGHWRPQWQAIGTALQQPPVQWRARTGKMRLGPFRDIFLQALAHVSLPLCAAVLVVNLCPVRQARDGVFP